MVRKILTIAEMQRRMGTPKERNFCRGYSFSANGNDYFKDRDFDFTLCGKNLPNGIFYLLGEDYRVQEGKARKLLQVIYGDFKLAVTRLEIIPEGMNFLTFDSERNEKDIYLQQESGRVSGEDKRFSFSVSRDATYGHYVDLSTVYGSGLSPFYFVGGNKPFLESDARVDRIITAYGRTLKGFRKVKKD